MKAALIGCGSISRFHLKSLTSLPGVEISAICDLSPARAQAAAERFGVRKWYRSYEEMIDGVRPDLVHVTTPPDSHAAIVGACLSKGLNVLCEKPLTPAYSEFKPLRQLAETKGLMLMEGLNLAWHPAVIRILHLIEAGELGNVIDVDVSLALNLYSPGNPFTDPNVPHFAHSLPGGVIGDFTPHLATLAYLFAGPAQAVHRIWQKRRQSSPLEADELRALVHCERAVARLNFLGNATPDGFWLRVVGTRLQVETNLYDPQRLMVRRPLGGQPAIASLRSGLAESRALAGMTLRSFLAKLAGTSGERGIGTMIEACYASLRNGTAQPLSLQAIDDVARMVGLLAPGQPAA
jgi:predicted dehydrogenase